MSGQSVNKVFLIGRPGADAEVKTFGNGGKVANFSLATSDSWKDRDGEKVERVQWHRIAVFNEALAEICGKYVKKGTLMNVIGRLETRDYEKGGEKVYVTEVVLRPYDGEITLLDSKKEPEQPSAQKGRGLRREPQP